MINILQRRNQVVPQQNDIWTKFDALFVGERYMVKLSHVSGKDVSTAEDKSKTRSQNKTPRTMLKMMERHRENER